MSFWMYHSLTGSVYPVPTSDVEQVAALAEKLRGRIYFEAELTTQLLHEDEEWWVKLGGREGSWRWFFFKEEAEAFAREHDAPLFCKRYREAEFFLIKQELT